ncbi:MAG: helix-turn-helix transcriptional regulator [Methanoregula sp.]|jgi:DNA-binding HxlR family transcriptional regulator|nr:helix-turn-helix transcriptional regulator [Methanoregula sp.]
MTRRTYPCPVEAAIDMIGGKWKPRIVWALRDRTLRFSEIQSEFPAMAQRTLSRQLRDLEQDGMISRKAYPEIPPRVEYTLTARGKTVVPLLESLWDWVEDQMADSLEYMK